MLSKFMKIIQTFQMPINKSLSKYFENVILYRKLYLIKSGMIHLIFFELQ